MLAVFCGSGTAALAQLQLVAAGEPQRVFGGGSQSISLCWRNSGASVNETDIHRRLMQLTSATAVCIDESPWKRLQILPAQTVLETAAVEFPPVRAESRFLIQWCDNTSNILGSTDVLVYPTNLLSELSSLLGHEEGALGIYDPENQLKPLLKNANVDFVDLENTVLQNFRGRLAIIGPFESNTQTRSVVTSQIKTLSASGVAVVWIQRTAPNFRTYDDPQPSFYSVPENRIATVVARSEMVADLAKNPRSQLNLIYFCKLALCPKPLTLPSMKQML